MRILYVAFFPSKCSDNGAISFSLSKSTVRKGLKREINVSSVLEHPLAACLVEKKSEDLNIVKKETPNFPKKMNFIKLHPYLEFL